MVSFMYNEQLRIDATVSVTLNWKSKVVWLVLVLLAGEIRVTDGL